MDIDVSKCKYYESSTCRMCNFYMAEQLQQLKSELNEYKDAFGDIQQAKDYISAIQDENKELKKLNKANADFYVKWRDKLKAENEELRNQKKEDYHYLACMTEQRNKLQQKLEKIKDCISKYFCDYECGFSWSKSCKLTGCTYNKILQIINEGYEE